MASTDERFGLPMRHRAKFAASGFGLSIPLRFTRCMLNLRKGAATDIAFLGISSSRVFRGRVPVGLFVLLGAYVVTGLAGRLPQPPDFPMR